MSVGVIGSQKIFESISPLLEVYRQKFSLELWDKSGDIPTQEELADFAKNKEAVLLIGDRRRSPRTVLPAPVLRSRDSQWIPCGWLPYTDDNSLRSFANAAVTVHKRGCIKKSTVALLGQWQNRFLNLSDRIEYLLSLHNSAVDVKRWTSDYIVREDLMQNLQQGVGLSIYVGHGRPVGWVGYHGTRIHHFPIANPQPVGAMFSLSCTTASRKRVGLSFAEALVLRGMCAASFGAVEDTLHTDNARWSIKLCEALEEEIPGTIGEFIVKSLPSSYGAITPYRLLGDPMAPIYDAVDFIEDFSLLKDNNVAVY